MKAIPGLLGLLLMCGTTELKVVPPKDDSVLTDPEHRDDFVTLARQADSVVRVREAGRHKEGTTEVVTLDVVEMITGVPVQHLYIAASIWDVVALGDLRRENATFLLMVHDRSEILFVHSNGVPFVLGSGIIPVVGDMVPEEFAWQYDRLLILRPVTLDLVRQQLSRGSKAK